MIGYLNIISIKDKIVQLTDICKTSPIEILCIDESKLDSSFLNAQVQLPDYQFPPFQRVQNSSVGGWIAYIRNRIIPKRLIVYETQNPESICVEITTNKRKWGILFAFKPPNNSNLKLFFDDVTQSANQLLTKFGNIFVAGDFNLDTGSKNWNNCHTFDLTNLMNVKACFNSATSQPSSDVILTNSPRSFQKAAAITTGFNDYHKIIITTLWSSYTCELPRNIIYRNLKIMRKIF